ncbi:hypothetical protein PSENEW3_00000522 [Picochlorum sp. SENEW3]|nr:hypothetical protein PSENEW3_00000522 [Picochlorum sp. SENEW3]
MPELRSRHKSRSEGDGDKFFLGLVAKIECSPDKKNIKSIIESKLEVHGAVCAPRMRKGVTHVIVVKDSDTAEDDKRLERLRGYIDQRKKQKGSVTLKIVSALWVEDCVRDGCLLSEGDYAFLPSLDRKPPPLSLESSKRGQGSKRKKTSKGSSAPKPIACFDVNRDEFSSAKQLQQCHDDTEEEDFPPIGEATQAAAGVLASGFCKMLDIPEEEEVASDADDLDTPLSQRCCKRLSSATPKEDQSDRGSAGKANKTANEQNKQKKKAEKPSQHSAKPREQIFSRCPNLSEQILVSQRFSVRQLYTRPERPVLLSKNLPESPVAVEPVLKKTVGSSVPIPEIERVPSPWGTPSDVSRPGPGFDFGTASKARKQDATPFTRKRVPSPWSTLRPWDLRKKSKKSHLSQASSGGSPCRLRHSSRLANSPVVEGPDESSLSDSPHVYNGKENASVCEHSPEVSVGAGIYPPSQATRLSQEMLTLPSQSQHPSQECINQNRKISGVLAVTSVESSVLELCKKAVNQLEGLRLWTNNNARKHKTITHLIIGDNRRTLKTMLAVVHGAYLLRPEYITASLEAGFWLPEDEYLANVIFQEGAIRSREFRTQSAENLPNLLQGKKVSIYTQGKKGDESYQVVRRLAIELGATLFHISEADICILMNDEASVRPPGIPEHADVVKKDWLFECCTAFDEVSMTDFQVPRILSQ